MSGKVNQLETQVNMCAATIWLAVATRANKNDVPVSADLSDPKMKEVFLETLEGINHCHRWLTDQAFPAWPNPVPDEGVQAPPSNLAE